MEQRIDPTIQPDLTVGTDPAYIPGLTGPPPAGKTNTAKDAEPADGPPSDEAEPEEAPPTATSEADAAVRDDVVSPTEEDAPSAADRERDVEDESGEGEGRAAGPVFEATDRRGSITVDRKGVRFRLDDEEADFDWAEIGAVEVDTPRFGRRFTVTVHLAAHRFEAEVEASSRSVLKEWAEELDAVLDVYFED